MYKMEHKSKPASKQILMLRPSTLTIAVLCGPHTSSVM